MEEIKEIILRIKTMMLETENKFEYMRLEMARLEEAIEKLDKPTETDILAE